VNDLAEFLRARLADIEQDIRGSRALTPGDLHWSMPDWLDRNYLLAEVDAKRRILDEHAPKWRTVEWPHDQNGKGEAQVCRRCQNAEHTEWHPPEGQAGCCPRGSSHRTSSGRVQPFDC
jgi:hypothetical protein